MPRFARFQNRHTNPGARPCSDAPTALVARSGTRVDNDHAAEIAMVAAANTTHNDRHEAWKTCEPVGLPGTPPVLSPPTPQSVPALLNPGNTAALRGLARVSHELDDHGRVRERTPS
jgi:hypothetical protein